MGSKKCEVSWKILVVLIVALGAGAWAAPQQTSDGGASAASADSATTVPHLITFSGAVNMANGSPVTGQVSLTFSLYTFQQGGSPLWSETQQVKLDSQGRYTVLLGATEPSGLPLDLFTSGQAQWLGVMPQVPGVGELPRVLMVGMPYALRAVDADTLGGLPASAYLTSGGTASGAAGAEAAANGQLSAPAGSQGPATISGGGTTDYIPIWTNSTTLGNSTLFETASKVGIGTISPAGTLDVNGSAFVRGIFELPNAGTAISTTGYNSQPFDSLASAYNSATHGAVSQHFRWQAEPVGNNTSSPAGKYNLLFASGTTTPVETGLSISSKGLFTFAPGQTFPDTGDGTVTSVGSGAGLTGGPITTSGTLSIASAGVTNTMLQHSSLTVTAGPGLSGGGLVSLGGSTALSLAGASCAAGTAAVALPLGCAPFATLGANSFNGNQAVNGNLSGTGELAAGGPPSGNVSAGTVEVDAVHANNGGYAPGLNFAGGGEAITSNRNSGNQYGLDLFTNYTPRLSITNGGQVGIGTQSPQYSQLEVDAPANFGLAGALVFGASGDNGLIGTGVIAEGGADTSSPGNFGGAGGEFFGGNSTNGTAGNGIIAYVGSGAYPADAGYFAGDVDVVGNLSKSGGSFKIDHPLDPANKYLYHSFVESPDMMNIYNGNVVLDSNGEAVIELPDWFGSLNRDYRYQLTCVGGFAPVYIAEEITNNQFKIAGGKAGLKVSWQVTGIRQDAWANAHRIPVEVDKPARERGYYIHPELYGAPPEKSIEWARNPEMMKRMQAERAKQAQAHKP